MFSFATLVWLRKSINKGRPDNICVALCVSYASIDVYLAIMWVLS